MFKHSPNPMFKHSPKGMVYGPEVIVVMVDNKIQLKRYNVDQNETYSLHEVEKRNVTSSF